MRARIIPAARELGRAECGYKDLSLKNANLRYRCSLLGSMLAVVLVAGLAASMAYAADLPGDPEPLEKAQTPKADAGLDGPDEKKDVKPGREEPEYRVKLKSGAVFEGELKAEAETTEESFVVLIVAGVEMSFGQKDIESFTKLPSIEERYKEMRAAIASDDTERLVSLGDWLRARRRFDLAAKEVQAVLKLEPANKRAKDLMLLIEQQSLLAQAEGSGKPLKDRVKVQKQKFPVLNEEQTNLMKVFEVDLKEPGRVVIGRELIEQLINRYGDHASMPSSREGKEALYRASPETLLELMFRVQARELYGKVKLIDTPRPVRLFRENVNRTWLLNSCATTACHGGEGAGRFRLNPERAANDATILTNMFILDRFRLKDGKALINYEAPASSPLLQYGLPADQSKQGHPDVTAMGFRKTDLKPAFRDVDDQRFQQGVEWIRSLYKPRPNYPFGLMLPGLENVGPASEPGPSNLGAAPTKTAEPAKTPTPKSPTPPAASPGNDDFPK